MVDISASTFMCDKGIISPIMTAGIIPYTIKKEGNFNLNYCGPSENNLEISECTQLMDVEAMKKVWDENCKN